MSTNVRKFRYPCYIWHSCIIVPFSVATHCSWSSIVGKSICFYTNIKCAKHFLHVVFLVPLIYESRFKIARKYSSSNMWKMEQSWTKTSNFFAMKFLTFFLVNILRKLGPLWFYMLFEKKTHIFSFSNY